MAVAMYHKTFTGTRARRQSAVSKNKAAPAGGQVVRLFAGDRPPSQRMIRRPRLSLPLSSRRIIKHAGLSVWPAPPSALCGRAGGGVLARWQPGDTRHAATA